MASAPARLSSRSSHLPFASPGFHLPPRPPLRPKTDGSTRNASTQGDFYHPDWPQGRQKPTKIYCFFGVAVLDVDPARVLGRGTWRAVQGPRGGAWRPPGQDASGPAGRWREARMEFTADAIREARAAAGLSQEAAARKVGVSGSTWAKWEAGRRDPGRGPFAIRKALAAWMKRVAE